MAAHLGETLLGEHRYDPRYPEGHYVEDRRYVAWLCVECDEQEETRVWFVSQVNQYYPAATIVRLPGSPDETPFGSNATPVE
jgi:hypothetical protein